MVINDNQNPFDVAFDIQGNINDVIKLVETYQLMSFNEDNGGRYIDAELLTANKNNNTRSSTGIVVPSITQGTHTEFDESFDNSFN